MKIITCTSPNASTLINGVPFTETDDGVVSEPVADEVAAQFDGIPGYSFADAGADKPVKPAKAPKADATKDQS